MAARAGANANSRLSLRPSDTHQGAVRAALIPGSGPSGNAAQSRNSMPGAGFEPARG